ncbi:hypothetical protein [Microtetraspora niveoalba]|uniref:hypothetical protein n=1 Tax=Microtetraspora niveoalba TaxID=46175 RepID=UPI001FE225B3|nr:hypothetical protein [Microtetraspora niveoalba]
MRTIPRTAALAATLLITIAGTAAASLASSGAPAASAVPASPADVPAPAAAPTPVKPRGGTIDPRAVRWTSAKPIRNGRYLRVTWWSGVEPCSVLDRVGVKETGRKVIVTLYEGRGKDAQMCIMIAVKKSTIVKLRAPLGDRVVVDGAKR